MDVGRTSYAHYVYEHYARTSCRWYVKKIPPTGLFSRKSIKKIPPMRAGVFDFIKKIPPIGDYFLRFKLIFGQIIIFLGIYCQIQQILDAHASSISRIICPKSLIWGYFYLKSKDLGQFMGKWGKLFSHFTYTIHEKYAHLGIFYGIISYFMPIHHYF